MENSSGITKSRNTLAPGSFRHGGSIVVGLGIVAAMTDTRDPVDLFAASSKSNPIAIVSSAARAASNFRGAASFHLERNGGDEEVEVDELSESYTCVITHLAGDLIRKRVYVDGKLNCVEDYECARLAVSRAGVFSASPADFGEFDGVFWTNDFLNSCFLCAKQLHGLDIFMYRGEKAFCSCDCREKHMRGERYREKCSSEAIKSALDCSASPCSSPHVFLLQVAAA